MGISIDTASPKGYIYHISFDDPYLSKELHYGVLEELFKAFFDNEYQKALVELDKVFKVADNSSEKYFKTFTFNNRLIRFERFENSTGFQFLISTKGYRP